jgi:hypothetical protein
MYVSSVVFLQKVVSYANPAVSEPTDDFNRDFKRFLIGAMAHHITCALGVGIASGTRLNWA